MNTEIALKGAKFAARSIVGMGVGKIVKEIIANNVSAPSNSIEKVTVYAGAAFVGMMAKDAVKNYVDREIDDAIAGVKGLKEKVSEAKKDDTQPDTQEPQESQEQS